MVAEKLAEMEESVKEVELGKDCFISGGDRSGICISNVFIGGQRLA